MRTKPALRTELLFYLSFFAAAALLVGVATTVVATSMAPGWEYWMVMVLVALEEACERRATGRRDRARGRESARRDRHLCRSIAPPWGGARGDQWAHPGAGPDRPHRTEFARLRPSARGSARSGAAR